MGQHARGVYHVGFTVSDLERSIAFYEALGFELERKFHSGGAEVGAGTGVPGSEVDLAVLRNDGLGLELIQHTSPGRSAPPSNNDVGAAHVCIRVERLQALYDELRAMGVDSYSSPHRYKDECDWVYLRDPDGITVELLEELVHDPVWG
jgi:catechol 2,3-dioxygenase-like lactoylglutathione lyase family enzyme